MNEAGKVAYAVVTILMAALFASFGAMLANWFGLGEWGQGITFGMVAMGIFARMDR